MSLKRNDDPCVTHVDRSMTSDSASDGFDFWRHRSQRFILISKTVPETSSSFPDIPLRFSVGNDVKIALKTTKVTAKGGEVWESGRRRRADVDLNGDGWVGPGKVGRPGHSMM
jgi:hypothetical protein